MLTGPEVFLLENVPTPLGQFVVVQPVRQLVEACSQFFDGHVRRLEIDVKQRTPIPVARIEIGLLTPMFFVHDVSCTRCFLCTVFLVRSKAFVLFLDRFLLHNDRLSL